MIGQMRWLRTNRRSVPSNSNKKNTLHLLNALREDGVLFTARLSFGREVSGVEIENKLRKALKRSLGEKVNYGNSDANSFKGAVGWVEEPEERND